MNIWFGLYLLISVLIALSIIVVCIKYRKKRKFIVLCFNCLFKSYYSYKHWFYFIYAGKRIPAICYINNYSCNYRMCRNAYFGKELCEKMV